MAYLDNSATTAVCDAAVSAMVHAMTVQFGNPSSLHRLGIEAEQTVRRAREKVASLMGTTAEQLVFTSGGTEANNLAILGAAAAKARGTRKAVTTMGEHASVAACFDELEKQGWQVTRVPLQADGTVLPQDMESACDADTALVSAMMVNNETGALLDIADTVKRVKRKAPNAVFHTDAVQAIGKLVIKADRLGVDLMTGSSHKIHGPKGCGVLYIRKGVRVLPRQIGGGQERAWRSGTEGVPTIVGFGAAAAALPSVAAQHERYTALKEALLNGVAAMPDVRLHLPTNGVPYIVNLSVVGFRSETLLHFLAERDVFVSGGSACSKGKLSPVLTAMGLPEREIDSAVRVSFSHTNTVHEVEQFCDALREATATLRRRS